MKVGHFSIHPRDTLKISPLTQDFSIFDKTLPQDSTILIHLDKTLEVSNAGQDSTRTFPQDNAILMLMPINRQKKTLKGLLHKTQTYSYTSTRLRSK